LAAGSEIASLVALAAPALEGASQIASLVALAHVVDSVSEQLTTVDAALKQSLIDAGAFGFQQLARLGRLGAYRDRILQSVSEEVAQQLLLLAAGQAWPAVSELLVARAYLADIQTLLDIGDPSASGGAQ